MTKKRCILIIFSFLSFFAKAQNFSVTGTVQDSINTKNVVYASVSVIRKSDSILQGVVRTGQKGNFLIPIKDTGKYILLIAHNTFVDYVDDFEITKNKSNVDLGKIYLFQRGQLLKEVIIKNKANIKIKGDTLEYLADSFKVKQGAMVEDLLKVLPGIQVNKNGEITAMGEKVEKIFVDGEEFFGDDPTVATQNIQSKVVDKVQVFDNKSEQTKLTGFTDGDEKKAINLKLKDGMNRGVFGKVELRAGLKENYNNQAMISAFKNKRQISAYALMNNLGKTGLNWDDNSTYGGGNEMTMSDGGDMTFIWNGDDDFNSWGQRSGITNALNAGVRYANKWDEGKHSFNTNYSFGNIRSLKRENSNTENLLPTNSYKTIDTNETNSTKNAHRISGRYEFAIDTNTTIIYSINGKLSLNESTTNTKTFNNGTNEAPLSSSIRKSENSSTTNSINNAITFNKKLKKVGRTISLNANYNYNNNNGVGYLTGENGFDLNNTASYDTLDQQKDQSQITSSLSTTLNYTEPLSQKMIVKATYAFSLDNNHSIKLTKIKNGANDYQTQIDSLSSDFRSKTTGQTVGAELKYNEKNYNITIGTRLRYTQFSQDDLLRTRDYNYNRINLIPTFQYSYKKSQYKRFSINYYGSTTQPTITQIQPIQDNTNPLIVYVGNPDLKIGYNHRISTRYNNYKVLSGRSLYTSLSYSNNFNAISTNRIFDNLGRTTIQYVNLKTSYSANFYGGINVNTFIKNLKSSLNADASYSHTPTVVNNVNGINNNYSFSLSPGLEYDLENVIHVEFDLSTTYTQTNSKVIDNRIIKYVSFNPTAEINYYLTKNIEFGSDVDYLYNPAVGPYAITFNRVIWNGYASYKMLANKNLEWRFSVNDILNQNKGYERKSTYNTNSERNYLTLGRYWLVGFIWNFKTGPLTNSSAPKGPPPGGRGGGGRPAGMPPRGGRK